MCLLVSPLNEVQAKAARAGDDKSSSSTSCSDVASTSYQMNETVRKRDVCVDDCTKIVLQILSLQTVMTLKYPVKLCNPGS